MQSLINTCFSTREELIKKVYDYYLAKNIVTVISRSDKEKLFLEIGCDRGGKYRPNHKNLERSRKSTTKKTDCQFKVKCKFVSNTWIITSINETHNHEIDEKLIAHPYCRRLDEGTFEEIKLSTFEGVRPKQIMNKILGRFGLENIIRRDIYNARVLISKEELNNMAPTERTIEFFNNNKYYYNYQTDGDGSISSLFFSNNRMLALQYKRVFILDCTYCTNQYKYPLLNVTGITSTNKSFSCAFILMRNENESFYKWALSQLKKFIEYNETQIVFSCDRELCLINAIKAIFPLSKIIICLWHINMNILSNTKKDFKIEEEFNEFINHWNNVVSSKTEELFTENIGNFRNTYAISHPNSINYIEKVWLCWKTEYVSCYVDKYRHYGSNTSSRVESFHSSLKGYLDSAKCHIFSIVKKISAMIKQQNSEINHQENYEKIVLNTNIDKVIFKDLIYKVSQFAIDKISEQLNIKIVRQCTGLFTSAFGIPCVHKLRVLLTNTPCIPMSMIDRQWYLRQDTIVLNSLSSSIEDVVGDIYSVFNKVNLGQQNVLISQIEKSLDSVIHIGEPAIRENNNKGRKRKHTKSTKRIPSNFETVSSEYKKYKCIKCKEHGHSINNCPNRSTYK